MPSRTLAATIQSQLGANIIKNGTGRPTAHPNTSVFFRPQLSASCPETRFVIALTVPKLMMNEVIATVEASWKVSLPINGTSVRSRPTMPPTNPLISTSSANCCQFSRSPSAMRGFAVGAVVAASTTGRSFSRGGAMPAVPSSYLLRADRWGRDVLQHEIDELALGLDSESSVVPPLEADRRRRFSTQSATAYGPRISARQDLYGVG